MLPENTLNDGYSYDLFVITINSESKLVDPLSLKEMSSNDVNGYYKNIIENYQKLKQQGKVDGFLFFIHGGLNPLEKSKERLQKQYKTIVLQRKKYPIFINWDSSFGASLFDHWVRVREGNENLGIGIPTAPVVIVWDIILSIVQTPKTLLKVTRDYVMNLNLFWSFDDQKWSGKKIVKFSKNNNWSDDDFNQHVISSKKANQNGHAHLFWNINFVKIFSAPFVENIGSGVWKIMKKRTLNLIRPSIEFRNYYSLDKKAEVTASGALVHFLNYFLSSEVTKEEEVELIGHSMGTIVINEIVAKYKQKLNIRKVVFMGAACSLRDIENNIIPLLQMEGSNVEFYNLTLNENRERYEVSSFGLAPSGSLLIWIDLMFEKPSAFMDRTAGTWNNITRAMHMFPRSVRNKVFITKFDYSGGPIKHGDFSDFNYYDTDFWINKRVQLFEQGK